MVCFAFTLQHNSIRNRDLTGSIQNASVNGLLGSVLSKNLLYANNFPVLFIMSQHNIVTDETELTFEFKFSPVMLVCFTANFRKRILSNLYIMSTEQSNDSTSCRRLVTESITIQSSIERDRPNSRMLLNNNNNIY